MMKRLLALASALCLMAALAACTNDSAGTDSAAGTSAPAAASESTAAPASAAESTPAESAATEEVDSGTPAAGTDLSGLLAELVTAAELGTTIEISEIDLKAGGLPTDDIVAFAGAESNLAAENGGTVMIFQVASGTEQAMIEALSAWRDTRAGDDRYAEFETAREHTGGARIVNKDGVIVYAVSASGNWDALDAALDGV